MMSLDPLPPPLEEPLAELERELIKAYIAGAGCDWHSLRVRSDDAAKRLLADASLYATSKLAEIETRLAYLRRLQGGT